MALQRPVPSEVAALSASLRALGVGHSPIDAIRFAWDGSGSPAHLPLPPRGAAVHEWVTLWAAAMARNPRALERAGEWARRFGADAPHWAATGMDPAEADAARAAGELDLASVRAMAFLLPGGAPSR